MAQWRKLNSICQQNRSFHERVTELYSRVLFPYKIRSSFADWIEAQDWSSCDGNSETGCRQGEILFTELLAKIQALEAVLQNSQPFDLEKLLDLQLSKQAMKKLFDGQYGSFVVVLSRCLQEEKLLLESCNNTDKNELKRKNRETASCPVEKVVEAREKLCDLHQQISVAENFVHEVARLQDEFIANYMRQTDKLERLEAQMNSGSTSVNRTELANSRRVIQEELERLGIENSNRRNSMADAHINLAIRLAWLLHIIWADIRKWQNEQKLIVAGLSKTTKGNLDVIETLCDEGGKLLHRMIQQVEKALSIFRKFQSRGGSGDDKMMQLEMVLRELVQDYLPKHLQYAFIVEVNVPDRVLNISGGKSSSFRLSVRILGGKALGLGFSRPKVRLSLMSERELTNGSVGEQTGAAHCIAADTTFAVDSTGRCHAEFQGVRVENMRSIPHGATNGGVVTMVSSDTTNVGQKYVFVFRTTVHVCGCDISLQLMSQPILLTNSLMQEVIAKGLLVWDAAFSESNRKALAYKDTVQWADLAAVLSTLFVNNTGRGLMPEHLSYLAKLLFNEKKNVDFSSRLVTESQVIRNKLPGRKFSFWMWVWANMAAVKDLVNNEWRAGLIYGFISKEDARRKLVDMPRGTFLLRFSETNIILGDTSIHGYLTIAVIELDPQNNGRTKLYYVKDYLSPKDISVHGLSEILGAMVVADVQNAGEKRPLLCHLWPDTNRDFVTVFDAYRRVTMSRPNSDGSQVDEDEYKPSKFTIEIFLEDACCSSSAGKIQQQDSINMAPTSPAEAAALSSLSAADSGVANNGNEDDTQLPQYAIRIADDIRRPMATVQPIQSAMTVNGAMRRATVQPLLANGATASAVAHYAGAALSDMSDDDDTSMDSIAGNTGAGGATFGAAQPVSAASFAGAFAAFNLNYQ
jgi:hypothetical protein